MVSRKNTSNGATATATKSVTTTPRPAPMRTSPPTPAVHRSNGEHVKRSAPVVTMQAIAEASYLLWKTRGGNEVVNWLEAEATLKAAASRG